MAASMLQAGPAMRVRLTRKLAERIDGVDLSSHHVGDVFDLPDLEAQLLIAEEWGTASERRRMSTSHAVERRRRSSPPFDVAHNDLR
jgi:hypothetical protein